MAVDITDWIKERRRIHDAATPGPWWWEGESDEDWPQSDNSLMAGGEAVVIGWGYDASGINVEDDDANYITDALNTHPAALTALEQVLELHQPVSRFTMYGYEDYSFLSVEDAHAFAGEPFEVDEFRLCAECMRVEDGAENNAEEIGYETSLYPCATVQAIEGAIRRAKAKACAEGYDAGSTDSSNFEDVRDGHASYDEYEDTPNPYRDTP